MVNQDKLADYVQYYQPLALTSFILSVILFIFILITRLCRFKATRRLNYKLYLWTMLIDIINHLPLQFDLEDNVVGCKSYMIVNYIINFASICLNVALAYNIHMVFILNKSNRTLSEFHTMLVVIFASIVLTIPFATITLINPKCTLMIYYEGWRGLLKMLGLVGFSFFALTTYCLVIFIMVVKKLISHKVVNSNNVDNSQLTNNYIKKLIFRLCLYPLVPVLVWYPYILTTIIDTLDLTVYSYVFVGLQGIVASMQGMFNFLFFLSDPALPEIYMEIHDKYFKREHESKVQLTDFKDPEYNRNVALTYDLNSNSNNSSGLNINIKLV
ncbi:hypothetical protein CONCODRAFT_72244 [Conidiobolus coronatus NRRL 28638]|uniref:G-protein coupled receptors family 1 profile domain-containing protein n=1 Tax=Conidiobolus coronatus (strain ATCC 28846 / CBS 209.66 / NRRL 28638) TaxID=796925 RepID=A0A137P0F8_CONC2|nr:hypothetical protein CONCODRAFT_72244 [Conidiobolus coronatus NRRL 28638]|eukprot:KXN68458.1 hypothetical protein CONCODRAFT_72244 [Conidiobolus coronatus NRRL 28638]